MKPILKLKNVKKNYITRGVSIPALQDVSFEVWHADVICLLGPSGSGKSTCLRTINALENIDSGSIELEGNIYSHRNVLQLRRHTGMVFQRFELCQNITVLGNVSLGPYAVLGHSKKDSQDIAFDLLRKVGLSDHVHKFPYQLSGGQQQRVAIARALSTRPKIVLCDEPTSALDPELVGEILDLIKTVAESKVTLLIATHEISFARKVSNRCFFFEKGKLVVEGPTSSLLENPTHERLISFLYRVGPTQ